MPGSVILKRNIATAATAAAIAAGAVALPTFAQTGGSTTTTPQSGTTTTPGTTTPATPQAPWAGNHAQGKEQFDQRREAYRKALADELGISVDKLEAAEKAARETVFVDNLDEMVTNGRFTAAEAKTLKEAAANGKLSETLKSMQLKKLQEHLKADVTAGRLTQAQADEMLQRAKDHAADSDELGFGPGFGGRGHHGGPGGPGFGGRMP
ncbi:MAG: hypothetical protein R2878_07200 [Thermoleophilia bacterium]